MPSTQYTDECGVEDAECLGMTMEVTENSIVLRARNFRTGTFVDGYRFEIDF